jgi:hypothetical protein
MKKLELQEQACNQQQQVCFLRSVVFISNSKWPNFLLLVYLITSRISQTCKHYLLISRCKLRSFSAVPEGYNLSLAVVGLPVQLHQPTVEL